MGLRALSNVLKIFHLILVFANGEKPLWVPRAPSGSAAWGQHMALISRSDGNGDCGPRIS